MPWHRVFQGSFLSAFFGWAVMNVVFLVLSSSKLKDWMPTAVVSGIIVLGICIAILLPIYRKVSSTSVIWQWPISTGIGLLSGYLVMVCLVFLFANTNKITLAAEIALFNSLNIYASVCGAVAGLFAGLTARYFHKSSENN
jgi:hypothetical protein